VALVVVLAASAVFTLPSAGAAAIDDIETPRATPLGTVGGVEVVQYDGIFSGETSTGAFRVPYRITAPSNARLVNGAVVVEVPHDVVGLGTLDFYFGRAFLFGRGFVHAGVGYSTAGFGAGLQILDPSVPGTFIEGGFAEGAGRTDDDIVADFAAALAIDPDARLMVGRVRNAYVTGFSDAADPVLRLVTSGHAEGVFDLAVPVTVLGSYDPQAALTAGAYTGKVVIVNSAFEPSGSFEDTGANPDRYRFYAVAGTPHVPDPLLPLFSNGTTPASFLPALRAHFLQAHRWVRQGDAPPSSHGTASGTLLPIVQLGEAAFHTGFLGSYDDVQTITQLGFASHAAYLRTFNAAVDAYARSGEILRNEASDMKRRAGLCPPLTYTETYRDHYTNFVDITAC
jgi:Alpha/beta hydrolase domain